VAPAAGTAIVGSRAGLEKVCPQFHPGFDVWDAHAPSLDVHCGPPGLRSLGGVCAPPSMAALAADAGSRGMGTPWESTARRHSRKELLQSRA